MLAQNSISKLLAAIVDAGVEFVLVGGQAMVLHGSQRTTFDVDLVLDMSDENLTRFIDVAKFFGLKPIIPVQIDSLKNAAQIQEWHDNKGMLAFALHEPVAGGIVVDVLVRSEIAFDRLSLNSSTALMNGRSLRFAGIDDLLVMKRAANRGKDQQDIAFLEQTIRQS